MHANVSAARAGTITTGVGLLLAASVIWGLSAGGVRRPRSAIVRDAVVPA